MSKPMDDRLPFPWRLALCLMTLGAGLGLALAYGHTGDAIVLAVVILPGVGLLLLWPYVRKKANRTRIDEPS